MWTQLLTWNVVWASPSAGDISNAIQRFNLFATEPIPVVDNDMAERLNKGEIVKFIDQPNGENAPRRAGGMILVDASLQATWLACQDPHFNQQSSTRELRLTLHPPDVAQWYGFIDLPWPISDRHWVVKAWNNHVLAKETNNQTWEHPWTLLPYPSEQVKEHVENGEIEGVETSDLADAIYTPVNHGAWFVIGVQEQSILGYHATTIVGGDIPERLLTHYVYLGLDEMLTPISHRAKQVIPSHYGPNHPLITGGDGKPIKLFEKQSSQKE